MASRTLNGLAVAQLREGDSRKDAKALRRSYSVNPKDPFAPLRETYMRFAESVQYLLSLGHETLTIKLGLRNTELLLESLANPERSFPAVQIAGTNGKGSTAVMLDSICRAAGMKTGLYTSPHLV